MAEQQKPDPWVKRIEIQGDKVKINGREASEDEKQEALRRVSEERQTDRRIKEAQ
jgi:hypothetical protein